MKFKHICVSLLIFTFSYFKNVHCIECYQCNSLTEKRCDEGFIKPVYLKECTAGTYCRKTVQNTYFMAEPTHNVIRECGSAKMEDECYKKSTVEYFVHTCECAGKGCNSSPERTKSNHWMLLFLVLAAIFPP